MCIVGAGAAGITLALELTGTGIDVVLLESGGFDYEDRVQDMAAGETAGLTYRDLDAARLRYFGGTTNHWAGQSRPLDDLDFKQRDWVPDSGWPFGREELDPFMPRAERWCRLVPREQETIDWNAQSFEPDFPIAEGGFRPALLRYPEPIFSFGEVYRQSISDAPDVRCILHASVVKFVSDPNGRTVEFIRLASIGGRKATLRARHVILTTGGLENSRLLLTSGPDGDLSDAWPGLGNRNDVVGRYFMEHPNFDTGEVDIGGAAYLQEPNRDFPNQRVRLDSQLSPEIQAQEKILNHSVFLVGRRRGGGRIARWWNRTFGGDASTHALRVRLEQAPDPGNRITLTRETDALGVRRLKLTLNVGALETRTVDVVSQYFARAVGIADIGRMKQDFDPSGTDWTAEAGWQYHHYGGTRMHDDPRKGVVNADCRMHDVENLFVAGSSVFPTGGHANPTLNLVALAIRLGDHIKAIYAS